MLADLNIPKGSRILDVGSSCGVWSTEFGRMADVQIVAVDYDLAPLSENPAARVAADAAILPFIDRSFDVIWCANTLMYVADPVGAVLEFVRCTKAGGSVAIKEEDSGRDMLLPWPEWLDVEVRAAWRTISGEIPGKAANAYMGRQILEVMRQSGLSAIIPKTYVMDRWYPFNTDVVEYVSRAFLDYRFLYKAVLSVGAYDAFIGALDPGSSECFWRNPDAHIVFLETVATGAVTQESY